MKEGMKVTKKTILMLTGAIVLSAATPATAMEQNYCVATNFTYLTKGKCQVTVEPIDTGKKCHVIAKGCELVINGAPYTLDELKGLFPNNEHLRNIRLGITQIALENNKFKIDYRLEVPQG